MRSVDKFPDMKLHYHLDSVVGTGLNLSNLLMNRQLQSLKGMKMAHPFGERDLPALPK